MFGYLPEIYVKKIVESNNQSISITYYEKTSENFNLFETVLYSYQFISLVLHTYSIGVNLRPQAPKVFFNFTSQAYNKLCKYELIDIFNNFYTYDHK